MEEIIEDQNSNLPCEQESPLVINWFPGHMHRTQKLIAAHIKRVDMVIELRDARIPMASCNPLLQQLIGSKPVLLLLNKADLCDEKITPRWIEFLKRENRKVVAISSKEPKIRQKLVVSCKETVPNLQQLLRSSGRKQIRAMIVGVPNVGKSTLLNTLSCSSKAKTGDRPAVTTDIQHVKVESALDLIDTPGVLWPKIQTKQQGVVLCAAGSIKDEVVDLYRVAIETAIILMNRYPDLLIARYKLDELPKRPEELIEVVGKKRGAIGPRGVVDLEKAAFKFLSELRDGKIGKITLEYPEDFSHQ